MMMTIFNPHGILAEWMERNIIKIRLVIMASKTLLTTTNRRINYIRKHVFLWLELELWNWFRLMLQIAQLSNRCLIIKIEINWPGCRTHFVDDSFKYSFWCFVYFHFHAGTVASIYNVYSIYALPRCWEKCDKNTSEITTINY